MAQSIRTYTASVRTSRSGSSSTTAISDGAPLLGRLMLGPVFITAG